MQNMQVIIIVMLLTYTSLYKIIAISLKNHRLASARKAVALPKHNVYIPIKSDTVFVRQLPTPTLASDCQHLSMDIRTIRQPRCRVFGSVAKSFPPSTQRVKVAVISM